MDHLLATYIDGIYWRSALEVMLYPTGCSFYRPFSYRKTWAGSDVVATPQQGPLGNGIIGLRFLDAASGGTRNLFIPLRLIDAVCIRDHDEFHVSFRLGPYIHHTEIGRFTCFDLSQKLTDHFVANQEILLSKLGGQFATELANLPTKRELPPDIWDRFVDDPNLKKEALKKIENAVILHLVRIRQRNSGAEISPTQLEELSPGIHSRSGYRLGVGRVYDVELIHKTLSTPGAIKGLQRIAYDCRVAEGRFRLSRTTIPQTGNYREEQVWLQPHTIEPAPTLLDWEPRDEGQPANAQSPPERAVALHIPFLAAGLPWYQFKRGRLWTGIVFVFLSALFFGLAVMSAKQAQPGAQTPWPAVYVALGAVCAPVGASALSRWWDEREESEG